MNYIRIGMYVDGIDVNYWKRVNFITLDSECIEGKATDPIHVMFNGFPAGQDTVTEFMFSDVMKLKNNSLPTTTSCGSSIGEIKIIIHEATISYGTFKNVSKSAQPSRESNAQDIKPVGRPSVVTSSGKVISGKEIFKPLEKWSNVSNEPFKTIILRYHTRSKLDFLLDVVSQGGDIITEEPSLTRKRKIEGFVDLTTEETEPDKHQAPVNVEDEVVSVPIIKTIAIADLTDDDNLDRTGADTSIIRWSTVTTTKY
jgi:hypothetical protein